VKVLEQPYYVKYLDELWALPAVPGLSKKSLVIGRVGDNGEQMGSAYAMSNYQDFRNREFDELYEWASTPRTQDQTKLGQQETNEKNKQYG
jgi:hypothetical protein